MKKHLIILIIILATSAEVIGQENPKINEVGISLQSLNSFGVTYKYGTTNGLIRFQGLGINGDDYEYENLQDSLKISSKGFSISIRAGYEWRSTVADKIELRYGGDLFYGYSIHKDNSEYQYSSYTSQFENTGHSYGLGGVLGANYLFTNNLFIGIEIMPSISKQNNKNIFSDSDTNEMREATRSNINYELNLNNALLTLGFRF